MQYPHQVKIAAAHAADVDVDSVGAEGLSATITGNPCSLGIRDDAEDDQAILWGDLFIDMRHLQRMAQAAA